MMCGEEDVRPIGATDAFDVLHRVLDGRAAGVHVQHQTTLVKREVAMAAKRQFIFIPFPDITKI